ncbi:ParB/RepB/Spo0J family partition protein [Metapseudomonas otitidis]|uniref:ParB/RepB/Spo0J family partition protein n=1 Tax=Metapseudomonas otitidis TaxID=319939 RepID=UPI000D19DD25|nr:ParB/RepB/Spo0J family partition protein [Pseudomonas otitidis]
MTAEKKGKAANDKEKSPASKPKSQVKNVEKKESSAKAQTKKPDTKKAATGFGGLSGLLGGSQIGALTDSSGQDYSEIIITDIVIKDQDRVEFDSLEETIEELSASIKEHGVIQPIIVRPIDGGKYELVAGERRVRASLLAGLTNIPAIIRELTDEQAADIQFAENVQRKNLTQFEVARRLQKDVQELGSVKAACERHKKSLAWASKQLSLLELGPEAQRLVIESVTADTEVIGQVRVIERIDPEAARVVVDELRDKRGQPGANAREIVSKAKEAVKPSTRKPSADAAGSASGKTSANPDNVAKPKDESHKDAGPVVNVPVPPAAEMEPEEEEQETAEFDASRVPALPPVEVLSQLHKEVQSGKEPRAALESLQEVERDDAQNWLHSFYDTGTTAENFAEAVIQGFRTAHFSHEGHGALALAAFLMGCENGVKFSFIDVLKKVKP